MGNPYLRVGTLPYYDWDKDKNITYVIAFGRYLNCSMLVYDKEIKKDKDFVIVKGQQKAIKIVDKMLLK